MGKILFSVFSPPPSPSADVFLILLSQWAPVNGNCKTPILIKSIFHWNRNCKWSYINLRKIRAALLIYYFCPFHSGCSPLKGEGGEKRKGKKRKSPPVFQNRSNLLGRNSKPGCSSGFPSPMALLTTHFCISRFSMGNPKMLFWKKGGPNPLSGTTGDGPALPLQVPSSKPKVHFLMHVSLPSSLHMQAWCSQSPT